MHVGTITFRRPCDRAEGPPRGARLERKARTSSSIWRNLEPEQAERQAEEFVRERVDVIVAFEDSVDRRSARRQPRAGRATRTRHRDPDRLPASLRSGRGRPRQEPLSSRREPDRGLRTRGTSSPSSWSSTSASCRGCAGCSTLVDPTDPSTKRTPERVPSRRRRSCREPLELDIRKASRRRISKRIFGSLRPGEVDAAFLLSTNLRLNHSALTIQARPARQGYRSTRHRKEWVEKGALFSFGADLDPIGRAGGRYVDAILKGHRACGAVRRDGSRRSSSQSISRPRTGSGSGCRRR